MDDHLECQSNHKYLEASLFIDSKKGTSKNIVLVVDHESEKIE